MFHIVSPAQQLHRARKDSIICILIMQAKEKGHAGPIKVFFMRVLCQVHFVLVPADSSCSGRHWPQLERVLHRGRFTVLLLGDYSVARNDSSCACVIRAHTRSTEAKTVIFAYYCTFVINITEILADTSDLPDRKWKVNDFCIIWEITEPRRTNSVKDPDRITEVQNEKDKTDRKRRMERWRQALTVFCTALVMEENTPVLVGLMGWAAESSSSSWCSSISWASSHVDVLRIRKATPAFSRTELNPWPGYRVTETTKFIELKKLKGQDEEGEGKS